MKRKKRGKRKARKSVRKQKQLKNLRKVNSVKKSSSKKRGKRRGNFFGKKQKSRSRSRGVQTKKFDFMYLFIVLAGGGLAIFGMRWLINKITKSIEIDPKYNEIVVAIATLTPLGLAVTIGKKYPQLAMITLFPIAYELVEWAKRRLPVGAQTALAGVERNPLMPGTYYSQITTGGNAVTLTPRPILN